MPKVNGTAPEPREAEPPLPLSAALRTRRIKRIHLSEKLDEQAKEKFEDETYAFLKRRFQQLAEEFDDIAQTNFNPFLLLITAPVYNIYSPFEVAERLQFAKAFHGDDTAFGKVAESKFLPVLGASHPVEKRKSSEAERRAMTSQQRADERARLERWSPIDLEATIEGCRYLMSVKAGPWTMNQAHQAEMSRHFQQLHDETGAKLLIGITYGRYKNLNNKPDLVDRNLGRPDWYDFLVGKDFWEFVSGVKDVHRELFAAIRRAQKRFADEHSDETFSERLVGNRLKIASSLRKQFNVRDDNDFWGTLFNAMFEGEAGLPGHPERVPAPLRPDDLGV